MPLTLNNKIKALKIGDYFWCKYTAPTSGVVGTFSDMAKRSDSDVASSLLPITPIATSNGYFKFIVADIKNGKYILVADRSLQNIAWDNINSDGYVFGRQIKIDNNNESIMKYTLKLLSSSMTASDTSTNDWDKYLINSTLNGNITANDSNVWNHTLQAWTSTTNSTNTSRIVRANNSSIGTVLSSSTSYGYRPMLIIEKAFTNKSFILFNGAYKKYVSPSLVDVNTSLPNKAQFLSDGMSDLSIFDRKITTLPQIDMGASTTLGSGKQFTTKVDLKKYFDIRSIKIK
jgi:hypothetical protein